MIEVSVTEVVLLISNIVSWALYFRADEKRRNFEYLAKAIIENKEIREKVLSEFEKFKEQST
jgi:hypothetical protein